MARTTSFFKTSLVLSAFAVASSGVSVSAEGQNADVSRESNLSLLRTVDFQVERGEIVSSSEFAFIAEILGTSITQGTRRVPVTCQLEVADGRETPWGSFQNPRLGNVNLAERPEVYLHPEVLQPGETVAISAQSFIRSRRGRLSRHISASSALQSDYVIALRDGDPQPDIGGFDGQADAASFVSDYIVDGRMHLHENQVIYLFELGTSNLNSAAADFQDLVVIVTLAEDLEALDEVVNGPDSNFD